MEFKSPLSHQSAVKMFTALFYLISSQIIEKQALFVIFVYFVDFVDFADFFIFADFFNFAFFFIFFIFLFRL